MIKLAKQSWIDTMITKVSMKKNASLLERSAYPLLKCIRISKKINMFRLQETQAIAFTDRKFLLF